MDTNMGELIDNKVKLVASDGAAVTVEDLISDSGGQGDVYRAVCDGKSYALKWYKHKDDVIGSTLYANIERMCAIERPSDKFIWPQKIVTEPDAKSGDRFGYLMELFPDGYHDMNDFLRPDGDPYAVRFESYHAMLSAGMNAAAAMRELHVSLGMSYKDLNPNNFEFNPKNGDILVIDNDNVSADGGSCNVNGMNGYMAPEIQRSRYRTHPSTRTDYFSLAVILFRLFFVDHPMDGRRWRQYPVITNQVEEYCYAIKPIFCFDPDNKNNRPDEVYAPNVTARWRVMPLELRVLFLEVFTEGIDFPGKRPPENAWISAIARARDKLIQVRMKASGGMGEQFVNFEDPRSIPPGCMCLVLSSGYKVALYPGKAIYEISVTGDIKCYANIYAGVVYYPDKKCMGLRNLSKYEWNVYIPESDEKLTIGAREEVELLPDMKIEFQKNNRKMSGIVLSL